jgi:acyl-CoA carboxylase epsilon subunit
MAAASDEAGTEPGTGQAEPAAPFLRVVSGNPTPEEVAALVAVLAASGGGERPAPRRTPAWSHPARLVRRTPAPGPGGWRASGLPR